MAKLFSTPIACGLVTGALSGALFTWWQWRTAVEHNWNFGSDLAMDYGTMLLLCSGPALCLRSFRFAASALVWGALATVADMSIAYYQQYLATSSLSFRWFFLSSGISGAVIGTALWRMYGSRTRLLWAMLLGALAQIVLFFMTYLEYGIPEPDRLELWVMPVLLGYVVAATLPVILVDGELRKRDQSTP